MILSNILLGLIILFFCFRLLLAIREKQKESGKIRLISKKTGQILELNMEQMANLVSQEVLSNFKNTAQMMFKRISESFAAGHLADVKNYLSDNVLSAFREAIELREKNHQKADFTLIGFKNVEILEDTENKKLVAFTTEQINLLRDMQDNIIDGDPLYVATVKEYWTFIKNSGDKWVLSAVETKEAHFA